MTDFTVEANRKAFADALARIDELDRAWRGTDSHYVR